MFHINSRSLGKRRAINVSFSAPKKVAALYTLTAPDVLNHKGKRKHAPRHQRRKFTRRFAGFDLFISFSSGMSCIVDRRRFLVVLTREWEDITIQSRRPGLITWSIIATAVDVSRIHRKERVRALRAYCVRKRDEPRTSGPFIAILDKEVQFLHARGALSQYFLFFPRGAAIGVFCFFSDTVFGCGCRM